VDSPSAMDEISYAVRGGKRILPVLLRVCEIPYRLERFQYADFTTDYNTGFSQLLKELGIEQPPDSKVEIPAKKVRWIARIGASFKIFSSRRT
jgi:hypothetical protein